MFALIFPLTVLAEDRIENQLGENPSYNLSYYISLCNQYITRGMTQSGDNAALQGGLDFTHNSGLYFSTWTSNISWLKDNGSYTQSWQELDLYGGYATTIAELDMGYNVGLAYYFYPGNPVPNSGYASPNTLELNNQINYKWLTGVLHYTLSSVDSQVENAQGSYYAEINANIPIFESDFTANFHTGYQYYAGAMQAPCPTGELSNNACYSYADLLIGVSKKFNENITASTYFTSTNAKSNNYLFNNKNIGRNLLTFFVQKSWGN